VNSGKWKESGVDLGELEYSEDLFPGLPSRDLALAKSKDERFVVGIWEASKGVTEFTQQEEEFGHVLSGSATIEIEGEPTIRVGSGDILYVGRGKKVKWTVHGPFRKVYAIYE